MRFGILGTAHIARDTMIPTIRRSDHEVVGIASRDADRARQVGAEHSIPTTYGSYADLLASGVDAVYNPLPNALHAEWTKRAADAGVDVLCEKPVTTDAETAAELFEYCDDAGVTLMEAFMYRFHPRTERAREIVTNELGSIRSVEATFGFHYVDRDDIRYDADLGGGALLDAGCYPVNAALGFLGEPERAYAHFADAQDSGVDTDVAAILEYDDGRTARVATSFDSAPIQRYRVECDDGFLEVEQCFDPGTGETELVYGVDGRTVTETFEPVDHYRRQIEHFAECAETGTTPRIDRAESVSTMRILDALAESAARGGPVVLG